MGSRHERPRQTTTASTLLPGHRRGIVRAARCLRSISRIGRHDRPHRHGHRVTPSARPPRLPGERLLRLAARLVPESQRDEWLAEWVGEATHVWFVKRSTSAAQLRWRAAGAITDALWMRRRYGVTQRRTTMFVHDLRFAARSLARRPTFTAV